MADQTEEINRDDPATGRNNWLWTLQTFNPAVAGCNLFICTWDPGLSGSWAKNENESGTQLFVLINLYHDHLKAAQEYGLEGLGTPKVNWKVVQDRKNKIVAKHTKGLDFLVRKNKVDRVLGFGRLTGPAKNGIHTIDVSAKAGGESKQIKTKNIILATGSFARMLPGLEIDARILTNIEVLSLAAIPKSLVIIGSGAVGVEFASIYRSFGVEVTVIEALPRLVPVEDEEVSKELLRSFKKKSIN